MLMGCFVSGNGGSLMGVYCSVNFVFCGCVQPQLCVGQLLLHLI
jgi:hypothetical protein